MRHTGRTDVPLTERGRAQAAALAALLARRRFARVLASPLSRAVETCQLAGLGDRAEHSDALLEFDYGEAEGRTTDEMRERIPGWGVWTHATPGAETPADVGVRLAPVVAELAEAEGDVAIFAHGHVLRVLAALWIEAAPVEGARFALSTGTLSTLGWERETRVLRAWNA